MYVIKTKIFTVLNSFKYKKYKKYWEYLLWFSNVQSVIQIQFRVLRFKIIFFIIDFKKAAKLNEIKNIKFIQKIYKLILNL